MQPFFNFVLQRRFCCGLNGTRVRGWILPACVDFFMTSPPLDEQLWSPTLTKTILAEPVVPVNPNPTDPSLYGKHTLSRFCSCALLSALKQFQPQFHFPVEDGEQQKPQRWSQHRTLRSVLRTVSAPLNVKAMRSCGRLGGGQSPSQTLLPTHKRTLETFHPWKTSGGTSIIPCLCYGWIQVQYR